MARTSSAAPLRSHHRPAVAPDLHTLRAACRAAQTDVHMGAMLEPGDELCAATGGRFPRPAQLLFNRRVTKMRVTSSSAASFDQLADLRTYSDGTTAFAISWRPDPGPAASAAATMSSASAAAGGRYRYRGPFRWLAAAVKTAARRHPLRRQSARSPCLLLCAPDSRR